MELKKAYKNVVKTLAFQTGNGKDAIKRPFYYRQMPR